MKCKNCDNLIAQMDTENIIRGECEECQDDLKAVMRVGSERFLDRWGEKANKYIKKEREDMVWGDKWADDNERDIDSFAEQIAEPKHRIRRAWNRLNHLVSPVTAFKAVLFIGFWGAMGLLMGLLFIKLINGR